MTLGVSYNSDLSRVQIAISNFPNGSVNVERSINQLLWTTVRGGLGLPIVAGVASLDDFEFAADVPNFYRVTQASLEEGVDVFTASGTWTKPVGLVAAKITVVGGGGGGGSAPTTAAGQVSMGIPGGGGVISISIIDAATLGATETVTVGAGGTAGTGGGSGGSGGTSSFGTHIVANGGAGGTSMAAGNTTSSLFPASGGTTGTGQIVIAGGYGDGVLRIAGDGSNLPNGGRSFGRGGRSGSNGAGLDGQFGGGGGGTRNLASQVAAANGGAGGAGLVIVEHIFAG